MIIFIIFFTEKANLIASEASLHQQFYVFDWLSDLVPWRNMTHADVFFWWVAVDPLKTYDNINEILKIFLNWSYKYKIN